MIGGVFYQQLCRTLGALPRIVSSAVRGPKMQFIDRFWVIKLNGQMVKKSERFYCLWAKVTPYSKDTPKKAKKCQ